MNDSAGSISSAAGGGEARPGAQDAAAASAQPERVELILSHIEALPTLSPVAVQVLRLSSQPDADIREITTLVESDPSLTARVLKMCKRAERVTANNITTVERAIVLLGLDAVRSAMLSVEVYGLFNADADAGRERRRRTRKPNPHRTADAPNTHAETAADGVDHEAFWRYALGVACAAEIVAERHSGALRYLDPTTGVVETLEVKPDEAFLCGLLHDLGKLALDHVLPKAFARCVELAERKRCDVAHVAQAVCGLDHHVAGKRLAEHWGLPHALQDVIWLHNQPLLTLPEVPHRGLIAVTTVAQRLCRGLHIGWSGDFGPLRSIHEVAAEQQVDPAKLAEIEPVLFERLGARAASLGLEAEGDQRILLESIAEANRRLGALNEQLETRAYQADRQQRVLKAVSAFHSAEPTRRGLAGTMGAIASSVAQFVGGESVVMLWRSREDASFTRYRFDRLGVLVESGEAGTPPDERGIQELMQGGALHLRSMETLSWLGEQTLGAIDPRRLGVLRLPTPPGPTALALHDDADSDHAGPAERRWGAAGWSALTHVWGAAAAAAAQHEGAKRLGERLAEANRRLAATQADLVDTRSMARLGELAAGAAHEMNNPLTVLSGNAELLASRLLDDENRNRALGIVDAAKRLSDLITSLHLFADPPKPKPSRVNLRELIQSSIAEAKKRATLAARGATPQTRLKVADELSDAYLDQRHVGGALTEVIVNALESRPRSPVEVRAFVGLADSRLVLQVADDGVGMTEHAQRHACDPFFSEKPAGRQTGLGLSRARRLVELNDGELTFESAVDSGTTMRIVLRTWRFGAAGTPRNAA